jgi:hypothetical protein
MDDKGDDYKCNTCNKLYSSYKTLWKHNKIFHKNNTGDNSTNVLLNSTKNVESLNYKCRYCEKNYDLVKSRWKHEQKCKINYTEKAQEKQSNEIKLAEINKEKEIKLAEINKEIELEKFNHTKEIELAKINLELKKVEIRKEYSLIKKEQKSHNNPTIKKINKMLQHKINMSNSNLNSNNVINNNVQNIVHNHFNIEPFGKENILALISDKEKKLILNQGYESIEKLVEISCAGKYDQFKNIIITNKRDNDVYIFDDKSRVFINYDKNIALNKLVANRLEDVEEIYNEFDENNKLSDNNRKILSRFFIKFTDESKPFIDENSNNKEYKNYLDFKVDKVKNILFNNQDKILNTVHERVCEGLVDKKL